MMNLHQLARAAVTAVHPDEALTIYRSVGQKNVTGVAKPVYEKGQSVKGQVQSEKDDALYHANLTGQNQTVRKIFLYAESSGALKPAGIIRPLARGGDLIQRTDGAWWLVTAIIEDFSDVGWVCVRAALQTKEPDFSASDWWTP